MAKVKVMRREIHNWDKHNKPNKKMKISIRRRKSSSSCSKDGEKGNNEFSKLSADVVTSIFLTCPLNTLSLSRCVSKSWNEFIISSSFVHSHREQSKGNAQLLFMRSFYLRRLKRYMPRFFCVGMEGSKEELYTVPVPSDQINCSSLIVCSGLVCISIASHIYLCNPAIHQVRELPNYSSSASPFGYNHFGFGFLHSKNEFKVVHFFYRGPRCRPVDLELAQLKCEVLTVKGGVGGGVSDSRWKETAEAPTCHPVMQGLLVNECMYWFAQLHPHAQSPRIISLDFENETFLTICCPSSFETLSGMSKMDLNGMLCLPDINGLRKSFILDLWILKDKISCTWVKEYSINLAGYIFGKFMPFFWIWKDEVIFRHSSKFFFYDLKRKCFREVKSVNGVTCLGMYSRSLFSLGSI